MSHWESSFPVSSRRWSFVVLFLRFVFEETRQNFLRDSPPTRCARELERDPEMEGKIEIN